MSVIIIEQLMRPTAYGWNPSSLLAKVRHRETQERRNDFMMSLTPGAQIDELRLLLRESEQRRQAAETKLADRERQLGTARQTIATQDHRIGKLTAELAGLRGRATATVLNAYALDFPHFFKSNSER